MDPQVNDPAGMSPQVMATPPTVLPASSGFQIPSSPPLAGPIDSSDSSPYSNIPVDVTAVPQVDTAPIDDVLNADQPEAGEGATETDDKSLLTGPISLGGGSVQMKEVGKSTSSGVSPFVSATSPGSAESNETVNEVQDVSTGDTIVPISAKSFDSDLNLKQTAPSLSETGAYAMPVAGNTKPIDKMIPVEPSKLANVGPDLSTGTDSKDEEDLEEPILQQKPLTPLKALKAPANTNDVRSLLAATFDQGASDLHLAVGYPPIIRVDGNLTSIGGQVLNKDQVKEMVNSVLTTEQRELLEVNKEVDLAIDYEGKARFRVNAFTSKGMLSAAFRLIPSKIRSLDELNLPKKLHEFCKLEQGLILVTGPTGHGKSTTLAALLEEINQNQDRHIITIEDPIEYVFPKSRGLVQQRELHQDTHSWEVALRSVLREDPDVVMVGEMRDFETIAATITVAETGHLVFATLHTNSAAQSIDRIIDVFPPHQQGQIRVQLANVLEGVISQRLLPKIGGGRVAAVELMMATPAVRNLIREQKSYQVDNIISTSYDFGMQTIERALAGLVSSGQVDIETAKRYSVRPEELDKLLNRNL